MLNESLFLLSFDELKDMAMRDLTILHIALVYILVYVIYKAFGRYIYFKPQEHASKINRTFLTLSLLVVALYALRGVTNNLPFLSEYRWLYMMIGLVFLIAPLSILMDRIIWKYDSFGRRGSRNWHHDFLEISSDYYKTTTHRTSSDGNFSRSWEDEVVESTNKNIHSDALLNVCALIVLLATAYNWAYESSLVYGWNPLVFFSITSLPLAGIFLDRTIFSWIEYLEGEYRTWKHGRKLAREKDKK